MICDFCSTTCEATTRYACSGFTLPAWEWNSVGDFYACDTCARLINSGNWQGLEDRAVATFHEHRPELDPGRSRAFVKDVQAGFRAHRVTG